MAKPRWVDCADEAEKVLKSARSEHEAGKKDAIVREAHAWMDLGRLYRMDRYEDEPDSSTETTDT